MQYRSWLYGVIVFFGFSLGMLGASLLSFFSKKTSMPAEVTIEAEYSDPVLSSEINNFQFLETSFKDLPGWDRAALASAIPILKRSCSSFLIRGLDYNLQPTSVGGTILDWKLACSKILTLARNEETNLRNILQEYFTPHAILTEGKDQGKFTGYYQPSINGSLSKSQKHNTPLYEVPSDMIQIDNKKFNFPANLKGLKGKISENRLVPYDTRKQIEEDSLFATRANILAWVNEVDAHILHIQGSGHIILDNGRTLFVGYSNNNGHKFKGIGSILLNAGAISRNSSSMQNIAKWLKANPKLATFYMQQNPRFIFFQRLNQPGAIGSAGIVLEPKHSLAVDPNYIPFGVPLWLDVMDADQEPLSRLVVALDSGAAIKGPIRGDFYWGLGAEAFANAGRLNSLGRYYLILPKSIQPHL